MSETVTVTLSKPITIAEGDQQKQIASLTFREATAGDACLSDLVTGETKRVLALLSGMCGQPITVLEKLTLRDLKNVIGKTESLMGEEPAAGLI